MNKVGSPGCIFAFRMLRAKADLNWYSIVHEEGHANDHNVQVDQADQSNGRTNCACSLQGFIGLFSTETKKW